MRKILALWLRLHRTGAELGRQRAAAFIAAYRERRATRELVQLDERTLRDIGLEPWRSPLGARIEQHRREMRAFTELRLGMY